MSSVTGTLDAAAIYAAHLAPTTRRVAAGGSDDSAWLLLVALAALLLVWESALPERRIAQAAIWVLLVFWLPHSGADGAEAWLSFCRHRERDRRRRGERDRARADARANRRRA